MTREAQEIAGARRAPPGLRGLGRVLENRGRGVDAGLPRGGDVCVKGQRLERAGSTLGILRTSLWWEHEDEDEAREEAGDAEGRS